MCVALFFLWIAWCHNNRNRLVIRRATPFALFILTATAVPPRAMARSEHARQPSTACLLLLLASASLLANVGVAAEGRAHAEAVQAGARLLRASWQALYGTGTGAGAGTDTDNVEPHVALAAAEEAVALLGVAKDAGCGSGSGAMWGPRLETLAAAHCAIGAAGALLRRHTRAAEAYGTCAAMFEASPPRSTAPTQSGDRRPVEMEIIRALAGRALVLARLGDYTRAIAEIGRAKKCVAATLPLCTPAACGVANGNTGRAGASMHPGTAVHRLKDAAVPALAESRLGTGQRALPTGCTLT